MARMVQEHRQNSSSATDDNATITAKNRFGTADKDVQEFHTTKLDLKDTDVNPSNIRSWFPKDLSRPVFYSPQDDGQYETLSYQDLGQAIGDCPTYKALDDDIFVVAVLLPLEWMTEMALTQLCVMAAGHKGSRHAWTCSHPVDSRMSHESVIQTLNQLKVRGIISTPELLQKYSLWLDGRQEDGDHQSRDQATTPDALEAIQRLIDVRVVNQLEGGRMSWSILKQVDQADQVQTCDSPDEKPILLLRTSGTTAMPKVVPLTARALYYNAKCQERAMSLTPDGVTLNSMPLFHIGGMSCTFFSVLASGSSVIHSGPFEGGRFLGQIADRFKTGILPTWLNAVPTLHTALILHVNTIGEAARKEAGQNRLRFVRSGAASLTSYVRDSMEATFNVPVMNSFAMSECMPICVQALDLKWDRDVNKKGTVGVPVGPSLRIAGMDDRALPYGEEGEICIKGDGVIPSYLGIPMEETHTKDGYLRTGDVGTMDRQGRVYLVGRSKDLIKRGGEQVWPAQVDDVIEKVDGVNVCVTFGVANDLWGEEICSAVVLEPNAAEGCENMVDAIRAMCRDHLDHIAVPTQIIFITNDQLQQLKGPSGKYLRRKFAQVLGVKAQDVATLNHLQNHNKVNIPSETTDSLSQVSINEDERISLSNSLKGVRIIVSLFVVMNHIGFFPNLAWEKIRSYNVNLPIFFTLGAIHLTTTVSGRVRWSQFVGTRIGGLHALFVISQLIALPAYLLFSCAAGQDCSKDFYIREILLWLFATVTGMGGQENSSNFPTWYITVFYQFIILFPFLHRWTRPFSQRVHAVLLVVFLALATAIFWLLCFGGGYNPMLWRAQIYVSCPPTELDVTISESPIVANHSL